MSAIATIGRSKESGRELIKLTEVPATMREGSANAKYFTLILKSTTSDEAAEKIRKTMDKPWDVIRLAIKRGVVKLGKKVATPEAPAKTKAAPKAKAVKAAKPKAEPKAPRVRAPRKPRAGDRRGAEAVL